MKIVKNLRKINISKFIRLLELKQLHKLEPRMYIGLFEPPPIQYLFTRAENFLIELRTK